MRIPLFPAMWIPPSTKTIPPLFLPKSPSTPSARWFLAPSLR
jgi:hypothetical protein